jgi:hypothetical protein
MVTGTWFQPAIQRCSCQGTHIQLMVEMKPGQVSGTPALKQSQCYPPLLGKAIVSAWLADSLRQHHSISPSTPAASASPPTQKDDEESPWSD